MPLTTTLLPRLLHLFRPTPFTSLRGFHTSPTLLSSKKPSDSYANPDPNEPIPMFPPGNCSDGLATDKPSAASKTERLDVQSEYYYEGKDEHDEVVRQGEARVHEWGMRDDRLGTYFGREAAIGMQDERGGAPGREKKGAEEYAGGRKKAEDGSYNQGYLKGLFGMNGKRKS